jgi:hypothetical protein
MKKNRSLFIATQLFSFKIYENKKEDFVRKLSLAKEKLNLKALMIGAHLNPKDMAYTIELCKKNGISPYLWYPMLADTPPSFDASHLKLTGYGQNSESFILEEQRNSGEDFGFLCPVKTCQDQDYFLLYKKYLETFDFEGVFLDKIRYPSPSNGLSDLLGCQCDTCTKEYSKRDMDPKKLFAKLSEAYSQVESVNDLKQIIDHNYLEIKRFLDFREVQINKLALKFIDEAREKHLKVGVDLFSPSLARIVSQDYVQLSKMADWIKPMLYLKTMGPAGLPIELLSLIQIMKTGNNFLSESDVMELIQETIGLGLPENEEDLKNSGVAIHNFTTEIKKASANLANIHTDIYPGFEAVDFPPICSMDSKTLTRYLEEFRKNELNGFVLSWDISKIPESYFSLVGDFFV